MDSGTIEQQPSRVSTLDDQSVGAIKDQCLNDIFPYLQRRLRNVEDAEDLTAEVFAAAISHKKQVHQVRAWLFGIARRKLADAARRAKLKPVDILDLDQHAEDSSTPLSQMQREEKLEQIRALVMRLPEDQRECLLLQYVEDLSINEISMVMDKSPAAVTSMLQRARATIYERGKNYFLETREEDR